MPHIKLKDANFYYELHGSGYPLILISGYTCDHLVWMPILESLSKKFQVLLFDNRGVGQTTDDNLPLSAELMAQDVISLADHLNLQKPHIIGQSMGGTIAQCVASEYPDKIGKLAILTSVAKWRRAMLDGLKSTLTMRKNNISFDLIFEVLMPWIFGEAFLSDKAGIATFKELMLANPYPQSLEDQIRQFQVLENFDGREQLKKITAETLVVHGMQDIITLLDESAYLVEHIPQAEFASVDAAHAVVLEAPQEVSRLLHEFLA